MRHKIYFIILIIVISSELLIIFSLLGDVSVFKLTGELAWTSSDLTSNNNNQTSTLNGLPPFTPFANTSTDPLLGNELIPNKLVVFYGHQTWLKPTLIKINSDGMRDVEYTIEKPPNTIRIAAIGDSYTFGWGVNLSQSWPKVLEKELNDMNSTRNYQVMNFGVPGYNTLEEVEAFKDKGLKYSPDVVIVGYVTGDAQNDSKLVEYSEIARNNIISWFNGTEEQENFLEEQMTTNMLQEDMTNNFQQNVNGIVVKSLEELGNLSIQKGFRVVVVYLTPVSQYEKTQISQVARTYNFCVIDTQPELNKYPLNERVLSPLDTHPNAFEDQLIANIIFNGLISQHCLPT